MAAEPLSEQAPAKVNLYLHVTGRRPDGYHELDSLVVFAGVADRLWAEPGPGLSLAIDGPFAGALSAGPENLVLRAAEALAGTAGGGSAAAALRLRKELPVAAGIGGGSADAAAALRLLARLWELPVPPELPPSLGADVPVCLAAPAPQVMRGIGDRLSPAPRLPEAWLVLVNPQVSVATRAVFSRLADQLGTEQPPPRQIPDFRALVDWLRSCRNDLERPAREICPAIGSVLEALSGAPLARMSGSGATCFALHPGRDAAEAMAERVRRAHPGWWVAVAPMLRGG